MKKLLMLITMISVLLIAGDLYAMGKKGAKDAEKKEVKPASEAEQVKPVRAKAEQEKAEEVSDESVAEPVEDEVYVSVNGKAIMTKRIDKLIKPQLQMMSANDISEEQLETYKVRMRKDAAEMLVMKKLLREEIKENGIKVEQQEIDEKFAEIAKQQNMTAESMRQQLMARGMDPKEIEDDLKFSVAVEKLIDKKSEGQIPEVSDEDVKEYYDKNKESFSTPEMVRASHILVNTRRLDAAQKAEAKKKAEGLLSQIKEEGGDFESLAKDNSDCPSSQKGGDLGYQPKGKWVPAFSDAAFSMEVGEISDLVETPFGYHIIKVTGKKPASEKSLDEVKSDIKEFLSRKNKGEFARNYFDKLKKGADIKWMQEAEAPVMTAPATEAPAVEKDAAEK